MKIIIIIPIKPNPSQLPNIAPIIVAASIALPPYVHSSSL